ncbi:MAG: bifunctional folylpolyglutamate synthase/dihydrofolate synthase [Candidatus Aminicenantes bacterium]|nr:bifunctional folylpolyglutamate synthase/dihydrofolate synthase [Candidatus Aminicenantes bacterium]
MSSSSCQRYLEQAQLFGIRLGLDNIRAVLESFDQPQESFPSIHVAGTNGKGSVCAMLSEIFKLHGYRTGLYTSPHLVEVRERIQINGEMIPEKDFCRLLQEVEKKERKLKKLGLITGALTFFEILTIVAFLYFRQKKIEMAILEVGMGGRYDATNVVNPLVSVITTISYDHQQYLGRTIKKIAGEKAGIVKEKIPCVCGVKNKIALEVIKKRCQQLQAPLIEVFSRGNRLSVDKNGLLPLFTFKSSDDIYKFRVSLPGYHQGENAATAILVTEALRKLGWRFKKSIIIKALSHTRWPGRLEIYSNNPLIIMDGCHNEDGARVVSEYLKANLNQPVILVFAVMKDKNIEKIAHYLFPLASRIILTRPPLERASTPEEIAFRIPKFRSKYFLEENVPSAIRLALALSAGSFPILIAGSLFLVGEAKKFFANYERHNKVRNNTPVAF